MDSQWSIRFLWFIFHPFELNLNNTQRRPDSIRIRYRMFENQILHLHKNSIKFKRDRKEKTNLHRKTLTQPTAHGKFNKHTDKYFPCPNILCHFFILCNSIFYVLLYLILSIFLRDVFFLFLFLFNETISALRRCVFFLFVIDDLWTCKIQ